MPPKFIIMAGYKVSGLCIKLKGHRSYTIAEIRGLHKLLKLHGYTVTGVTK